MTTENLDLSPNLINTLGNQHFDKSIQRPIAHLRQSTTDSNYTTYSSNQPLDKKMFTYEDGSGHKRIPSYIKTIPLTKMGNMKIEDERKKVFDTIASKIAKSN